MDDERADEELLATLREIAARLDGVPPEVAEAARASYTWRTIDAELAELTFDSSTEDKALAGVRGPATTRLLSFEAAALTVEVEITVTAGRRRILGQLVPGQAAVVEVHHAGGTVEVEADTLGRFAAEGIEGGPVRLDVRAADEPGPAVSTSWVTL